MCDKLHKRPIPAWVDITLLGSTVAALEKVRRPGESLAQTISRLAHGAALLEKDRAANG